MIGMMITQLKMTTSICTIQQKIAHSSSWIKSKANCKITNNDMEHIIRVMYVIESAIMALGQIMDRRNGSAME
jgi:hypothetical protein